jgi:hypothetical protein
VSGSSFLRRPTPQKFHERSQKPGIVFLASLVMGRVDILRDQRSSVEFTSDWWRMGLSEHETMERHMKSSIRNDDPEKLLIVGIQHFEVYRPRF